MLLLSAAMTGVLAVLFIGVSLLMMLVILIQRPKGGGLSGAFGGAGGSAQAAFGAKTGDVLTWVTVVFFALFLLLAMGLTWSIHAEVDAASKLKQPATITDTEPTTDADTDADTNSDSDSTTDEPDATETTEAVEQTTEQSEAVTDESGADSGADSLTD